MMADLRETHELIGGSWYPKPRVMAPSELAPHDDPADYALDQFAIQITAMRTHAESLADAPDAGDSRHFYAGYKSACTSILALIRLAKQGATE